MPRVLRSGSSLSFRVSSRIALGSPFFLSFFDDLSFLSIHLEHRAVLFFFFFCPPPYQPPPTPSFECLRTCLPPHFLGLCRVIAAARFSPMLLAGKSIVSSHSFWVSSFPTRCVSRAPFSCLFWHGHDSICKHHDSSFLDLSFRGGPFRHVHFFPRPSSGEPTLCFLVPPLHYPFPARPLFCFPF